MGVDGTIKKESEADLARRGRASGLARGTRVKAGKKKPALVKLEVEPDREIILRLIELIKQV